MTDDPVITTGRLLDLVETSTEIQHLGVVQAVVPLDQGMLDDGALSGIMERIRAKARERGAVGVYGYRVNVVKTGGTSYLLAIGNMVGSFRALGRWYRGRQP